MKFGSTDSTLNCLSLTIDLGKILNATQPANGNSKITSDGKMIYMDKFGTSTFDPPRPFLVGPIVQDPSEFENYKSNGNYTVSFDGTSGRDSAVGKY